MASIATVGFLSNNANLRISRDAARNIRRKVLDSKSRNIQINVGESLQDPGSSMESDASILCGEIFERRKLLVLSTIGFTVGAFSPNLDDKVAVASEFADMPALRGKDYGKTKMRYPDYTATQSGLQYKDLRAGEGPTPKKGDTVVVDWDGYTIGYYGRIFEARNKTKGGSFEGDDKAFFKFKLGLQEVIPAFEEAVEGMSPGGIRR